MKTKLKHFCYLKEKIENNWEKLNLIAMIQKLTK